MEGRTTSHASGLYARLLSAWGNPFDVRLHVRQSARAFGGHDAGEREAPKGYARPFPPSALFLVICEEQSALRRHSFFLKTERGLQDVVNDVRAVGLSFIRFAVDYPGHFRLMFRNDLVDRSDPRLAAASKTPGNRLGQAVLAYRGEMKSGPGSFEQSAEMLCGIAALHGLANLVLEEKALHFFKGATAKNFVGEYLPKVIEHLYPRATDGSS